MSYLCNVFVTAAAQAHGYAPGMHIINSDVCIQNEKKEKKSGHRKERVCLPTESVSINMSCKNRTSHIMAVPLIVEKRRQGQKNLPGFTCVQTVNSNNSSNKKRRIKSGTKAYEKSTEEKQRIKEKKESITDHVRRIKNTFSQFLKSDANEEIQSDSDASMGAIKATVRMNTNMISALLKKLDLNKPQVNVHVAPHFEADIGEDTVTVNILAGEFNDIPSPETYTEYTPESYDEASAVDIDLAQSRKKLFIWLLNLEDTLLNKGRGDDWLIYNERSLAWKEGTGSRQDIKVFGGTRLLLGQEETTVYQKISRYVCARTDTVGKFLYSMCRWRCFGL